MEIEKEIIILLKKKKYGLSIEDVATLLDINRTTATKYLFSLEMRKKIDIRIVGKAKLHYPEGTL